MTALNAQLTHLLSLLSLQKIEYKAAYSMFENLWNKVKANNAYFQLGAGAAARYESFPSMRYRQNLIHSLEVSQFSQSFLAAPTFIETCFRLAAFAMECGKESDAFVLWELALRVNPTHGDLIKYFQAACNRWPEVASQLRQLVARYALTLVGISENNEKTPWSLAVENEKESLLSIFQPSSIICRYNPLWEKNDVISHDFGLALDVCPMQDGSFWVADFLTKDLVHVDSSGLIVKSITLNKLLENRDGVAACPFRIVYAAGLLLVLFCYGGEAKHIAGISCLEEKVHWITELDNAGVSFKQVGGRVLLGCIAPWGLWEVEPTSGKLTFFASLPMNVTPRAMCGRNHDLLIACDDVLLQLDSQGDTLFSFSFKAIEMRPWQLAGLALCKATETKEDRLLALDIRSGSVYHFALPHGFE